ncbi:hypothetical protein [Nocardioides sp.]|uniref:hypothetical protein n=1 Tax=Nocardioides sp. TaxID=35761 RepID=UPI002BF601C2|nr:hypothetical protein [Nocardioides sp.]HSX68772.1 hypothetical protein [Nocardioides sp.]
MTGLSPEERKQLARLGAHTKWAMTEDRTAATQPARDGLLRKFEDQVDPDRVLSPEERAKRAENAKKAHYQRMALASAKARRARKQGS